MWLGMADLVDEVHKVMGGQEGNGVNGNAAHAKLQWTAAMSGFVLRHFSNLVAKGVRTDKGFKDVHLNKVAGDLSEFTGMQASGSQVYNHLRKWRARWVKICRLKDLSGANWDESTSMISLVPEHYAGHVKVHDANSPLIQSIYQCSTDLI